MLLRLIQSSNFYYKATELGLGLGLRLGLRLGLGLGLGLGLD